MTDDDTDTSVDLGDRFQALNTRRLRYAIASGVALVFLGLAAVIAFSAGPLPTRLRQQLTGVFLSLPVSTSQALLVSILGGLGLLYLRYDATTNEQAGFLVDEAAPPETPRNAPRIAGDTFERDRTDALTEIRLKQIPYRETDPHQTLCELVQTVVQLRENCSDAEAERAVNDGAWTSDPVAQAFCSETIAYPARFRVLRWGRPDIAYETAVTRTTNALSQFVEQELNNGPATTASQDATEPPADWLETIEAALKGVWSATRSTNDRGTNRPDEQDRPLSEDVPRGDD